MDTQDDGRQPIAIGHLSDSGDLKKTKIYRIHICRLLNTLCINDIVMISE